MTEQNNEQLNETSQDILRRVEQNDATLTELQIGNDRFSSRTEDNYFRLGTAISTNTNITKLEINVLYSSTTQTGIDSIGTRFHECLKLNSSIRELKIRCCRIARILTGVGEDVLKSYQQINNHLTHMAVLNATNLRDGGDNIITTTLQYCTSIKELILYDCNIAADQLLPMVEAVRGYNSLEKLYLNSNRVGNAGCEILATLLEDPNSNLAELQITSNGISNEGAVILANSLANNTKLKQLFLDRNQIDSRVEDVYIKLLCNTSSVNDTYNSNHTLSDLCLSHARHSFNKQQLLSQMNNGTNKKYVAILKILRYHPNNDMKPLFTLDLEDDEDNIKALPYVVAWFERAWEAVAFDNASLISLFDHYDRGSREPVTDDEEESRYTIDGRKLSAIYQFVHAMPLQFVPASQIEREHNKRRRDE